MITKALVHQTNTTGVLCCHLYHENTPEILLSQCHALLSINIEQCDISAQTNDEGNITELAGKSNSKSKFREKRSFVHNAVEAQVKFE